jgi:hypothetical protein
VTSSRFMPSGARACRWLASDPGASRVARALFDNDLVLGHNLHGAIFGDVDDAAAHTLPVRQIDEDLIAWPPSGFQLVHGSPASAARLLLSRRQHRRGHSSDVTRFRGLPTCVRGEPPAV